MAIKEKNAREMWCPFKNEHCRGWQCMAWRWENGKSFDYNPIVAATCREREGSEEYLDGNCHFLEKFEIPEYVKVLKDLKV